MQEQQNFCRCQYEIPKIKGSCQKHLQGGVQYGVFYLCLGVGVVSLPEIESEIILNVVRESLLKLLMQFEDLHESRDVDTF